MMMMPRSTYMVFLGPGQAHGWMLVSVLAQDGLLLVNTVLVLTGAGKWRAWSLRIVCTRSTTPAVITVAAACQLPASPKMAAKKGKAPDHMVKRQKPRVIQNWQRTLFLYSFVSSVSLRSLT